MVDRRTCQWPIDQTARLWSNFPFFRDFHLFLILKFNLKLIKQHDCVATYPVRGTATVILIWGPHIFFYFSNQDGSANRFSSPCEKSIEPFKESLKKVSLSHFPVFSHFWRISSPLSFLSSSTHCQVICPVIFKWFHFQISFVFHFLNTLLFKTEYSANSGWWRNRCWCEVVEFTRIDEGEECAGNRYSLVRWNTSWSWSVSTHL